MTKKAYKTHKQLGISFAEWGALWGFKAIAEAGILLKHVPANYRSPLLLTKYPGAHFFDMSVPYESQDCGSVACIGGTVAMFCRKPYPSAYVYEIGNSLPPSVLKPLYFPKWNNGRDVWLKTKSSSSLGWHRITLAMAAAAVDNFLRTGNPNWDKVIPTALRSR